MYFGENDCVWCGKSFDTKEEHDKHYSKCVDENHIKPDKIQSWEIINNHKNY